ncbi:TPA: HDIG domain-containing protein [Candidatus Woesearchaeota archaeon]|nr:HDIG domain-containing protein [Candidatus Woesearchaeota archaeon]
MSEIGLAPAVVHHSILVRKFALQIADELAKVGHSVDRELVAASALLHDIMKMSAEFDHAIEGGELLKRRGFHPVAELVRKHALNNLDNPDFVPRTTEEKLLMYADLRVSGGGVVSLAERFDYIKRQYNPKDPDRFKGYQDFAYMLEDEFIEKLGDRI